MMLTMTAAAPPKPPPTTTTTTTTTTATTSSASESSQLNGLTVRSWKQGIDGGDERNKRRHITVQLRKENRDKTIEKRRLVAVGSTTNNNALLFQKEQSKEVAKGAENQHVSKIHTEEIKVWVQEINQCAELKKISDAGTEAIRKLSESTSDLLICNYLCQQPSFFQKFMQLCFTKGVLVHHQCAMIVLHNLCSLDANDYKAVKPIQFISLLINFLNGDFTDDFMDVILETFSFILKDFVLQPLVELQSDLGSNKSSLEMKTNPSMAIYTSILKLKMHETVVMLTTRLKSEFALISLLKMLNILIQVTIRLREPDQPKKIFSFSFPDFTPLLAIIPRTLQSKHERLCLNGCITLHCILKSIEDDMKLIQSVFNHKIVPELVNKMVHTTPAKIRDTAIACLEEITCRIHFFLSTTTRGVNDESKVSIDFAFQFLTLFYVCHGMTLLTHLLTAKTKELKLGAKSKTNLFQMISYMQDMSLAQINQKQKNNNTIMGKYLIDSKLLVVVQQNVKDGENRDVREVALQVLTKFFTWGSHEEIAYGISLGAIPLLCTSLKQTETSPDAVVEILESLDAILQNSPANGSIQEEIIKCGGDDTIRNLMMSENIEIESLSKTLWESFFNDQDSQDSDFKALSESFAFPSSSFSSSSALQLLPPQQKQKDTTTTNTTITTTSPNSPFSLSTTPSSFSSITSAATIPPPAATATSSFSLFS